MRRSTDPGADGCPSSGVVRNRYAEEDATAPAAMTPLMKPRRDTDGDVSSGIFLSSIAGSPRRVGIDRMERDLIPATIIRYASQINGSFILRRCLQMSVGSVRRRTTYDSACT